MIIRKFLGIKNQKKKKEKKENSEIIEWLTKTHIQISTFSSLLGTLSSAKSLKTKFYSLSLIISQD